MMLSITFEPMRFSQARSKSHQFLFLVRVFNAHLRERPGFFCSHLPTRRAGFDSFDSNPFLPGWSVSG
jgi:hypothetical protein